MRKQITITREYSDHRLRDIFTEANESGTTAPLIPLTQILKNINGGAVCIAADSCTDMIAGVCSRLNKDVRQYLLLSDKSSAKRILGEKYVRILKVPQNGMVLIHVLNKRTKAWLFSDSVSDFGYEVPEGNLGEDLYKTFCNLFWSKQIETEFRGNDAELTPYSPLGQELSIGDRCSMPEQATDALGRFKEELYLQDIESEVSSERFMQLHLSDTPGSEKICQKTTGKAELFDQEKGIGFTLAGNGNNGYLLPKRIDNKAVNWSVPLEKNEYTIISKSYGCSWKFVREISLSEAVGKKIRYADTFRDTVSIEERKTINDEYRCETIDVYREDTLIEKAYLTDLDESYPTAATIDYTIAAMPPLVPANAKKDMLYSQWEKISKEWTDALDGLKAECDKYYGMVPESDGKISISLGHTKDDLCVKIDALSKITISIQSKAKRDHYLEQYGSLCNECEEYRGKCDETSQRKKFEDERRKQIAQRNEKISKLEGKIDDCNNNIKKLEVEKAKDNKIQDKKKELKKLQENMDNEKKELDREEKKNFQYEPNPLHGRNRIVAKTFNFPAEELPAFPDAELHNANGIRYISIPASSEESCLDDHRLLDDAQRLKAKIVVRD